jgi:Leucine-rich repeat (LRR) protein
LLTELPDAIGDAAKLEALTVNENKELTALPATLAKCKKLKSIKCDGCPIKDNKVLGYIAKGEYKQLGKYLEKTAKQGGRGGGKGKKKK